MPTQWYTGRVNGIKQLTESTRQFSVDVSHENGVFQFIPGQFVTMDLPVSEKD